MAACGLRENEPQMNADEYGYTSVTYFSATHRKGRKERKVKQQDSLLPLLHNMKKHSLSELRTWMTRIRRIFMDTANPCASVSSVQSVLHHSFSGMKPAYTKVSAFICVHLRFLKKMIFRTGLTGLTGLTGCVLSFNSVNPVILSNLKCWLPVLRLSMTGRK